MLINDVDSFDQIFGKQMDFEEQNDLLYHLPIEPDVPMLLDETIDFPNLQNTNYPPNSATKIKTPTTTIQQNYLTPKTEPYFGLPDTVTDANELNLYNNNTGQYGFVNPDDFLNDVEKIEVKSEINSPPRNTPSPSESSGSSDFSCFTKNIDLNQINYINLLDSPPISPPSHSSSPTSPQPILINSTTRNSGIKIMQGTLIPIKTVPLTSPGSENLLKKIKIQPKPSNGLIGKLNHTSHQTSTNKKTIILSANDFSALVRKVKSSNDNSNETGSIIIKKEPNVLPKTPIVMSTQPPLMIPSKNLPQYLVQEIDEKVLKKQQRMIKNRASASMSRTKKKEYVTSLEKQISQMSMEKNNLQMENAQLRERLAKCTCKNSGFISSPVARKNTAILLAMVFMVSLNFGSFGLFNNEQKSEILKPKEVIHSGGRGLLWIDDEKSTTYNQTETYFENSTETKNGYPICPMYINQTESIRLDSELRRWIGDTPEYYNLSSSKIEINSFTNYLFPPEDKLKAILQQTKNNKNIGRLAARKKLRAAKKIAINQKKQLQTIDETVNQIQVFNPSTLKFSEFFDEIRRRDDTFYVVSFSGDHLLLPALAHNKTLRPKMSLMLPVGNDSFSDDYVTLMQIDCEVINTSILQVREKLIPPHLRTTASKYNSTNTTNNVSEQAKRSNVTEKIPHLAKKYKPYFIESGNIYPTNKLGYNP